MTLKRLYQLRRVTWSPISGGSTGSVAGRVGAIGDQTGRSTRSRGRRSGCGTRVGDCGEVVKGLGKTSDNEYYVNFIVRTKKRPGPR
jgi:hypothetical protein